MLHLVRLPGEEAFSIERLFRDIRDHLPADVRVSVWQCPCESWGLWRRVANLLAALAVRADVLHVTGDVHYLTAVLPSRKTVLTIHDCVGLDRSIGWRRALLRMLWYSLPIRWSSVVVAISESTKQSILSHVKCPPDKIPVVHDCVSSDFRPVEKAFEASSPRLLFIGTKPNKNLERTVRALAGVPCHLMIIGQLTQDQRRLLDEHKVTHEARADLSDDELRREYELCDVVVFPSTYEGFGLPIVEAQAVGRPVVTSNIMSMPEVAGEGACLVDPWNVESIRRGVIRVIEDESYRSGLIESGFVNVKRFQATAIAKEYAAIYREVHSRTSAS